MRHVLSLSDLTPEEILRVLDLASELKNGMRSGERPSRMQNLVMGLLFQKPSLRTRVSFETLMGQLGGSSLFLGADVGWGTREPVQDFMPIPTSYLDLLVIRANDHVDVEQAARFSRCPIINGLTNLCHPCQALADLLTVRELANDWHSAKLAYLGDANNVAYSLAAICCRLGIQLTIGAPAGYQFDNRQIDSWNEVAENTLVRQTDDPRAAVEGADFVYTDVWASMGQEDQREQRIRDLADFQVNASLMSTAAPGARLLHCLPARRGEEVTTEVIEGPASAIIQQAENRLHAQKGLVAWLLTEATPEK